MAKKGILKPGLKLIKYMKDDKTHRCQFVKAIGEQCINREEKTRPGCWRCKYHGGKAGRPPTTGEHSKYTPLPKNLRARFEAAVVDPEILNLTKKIALLDSQIWEIGEEAQEQDSFDPIQMKKLIILIGQHRKLVAQETERRIAMGSMLDVQQVMQIIGYIYDVIQKRIPDPLVRRDIGADLRKVIGAGLIGLPAGNITTVSDGQ